MALEEAEAADRQDPAADSPQIAKEQYTADNLPAAFWDEYPQDSKNVDLAAINAILEESTPDERAETWKVTQPAVALFCRTHATRASFPGPDRIVEHTHPPPVALQGQGNDALKRGLQLKNKFYLREALSMYTKGLEAGSTQHALLSVLHSNRAQAHLLLGNYRSALKDSQQAAHFNASNLKVHALSLHSYMCMHSCL